VSRRIFIVSVVSYREVLDYYGTSFLVSNYFYHLKIYFMMNKWYLNQLMVYFISVREGRRLGFDRPVKQI